MSLTKVSNSMITGAFANVMDFGAVGNGTTDDTTAINLAIASINTGTNGGGTVFFPRGNYLTTSTIYLPQSVILLGTGRRPGPIAGNPANVEGSCIIGKHSGAAVVSCKGSGYTGLQHISLYGDQTTPPKTGLCVGRTSGGASSGRQYFEDILIAGYFTQAAIYSIAVEESTWLNVDGLLLGGGAKYTFYTSKTDDLSVDSLVSSSNWCANTFIGFNLLNQANESNSAAIYISVAAGTQGWTFRDGFTGMTSGVTSSHIWINVTEDSDYAKDFVFDCVGSESVSNASPPIQVFRVTSTVTCSLRGLVIKSCTPGQVLGGTQYYLYSNDSIILDGLVLYETISDYPSSVWRITNGEVNTPQQNLLVRSGIISSTINSKQTIHSGVLGQVTKTLSLNTIYGPVRFTGTGVNAMTIPSTVVMTGLVQRNVYVEIDGTSTPNAFKWSVDGGSTFVATGVPITAGTPQLLQDAIYIVFSQGTGLTMGDKWQCLFDPVLLPTVTH
jgi:hypothetical protein